MAHSDTFSGEAIIRAFRREPPGYIDLTVNQPETARNALPGQFVMLGLPLCHDPILLRPFDIVEVYPDKGEFRLVIKIVGKITRLMERLAPGDPVRIIGPLGAPITDFGFSSLALLVRGCGAAAVLYFLQEAKKRGIRIHTILSAATAGKVVLRREINALSDTFQIATDDGSAGEKILGSELLRKLLEKIDVERVYSCGGGPFYLPFLREITAKKTLPVFLFLESYMACGFGHCHGCAVKRKDGRYSLVCREGPLFNLDDVEDPCLTYQ